MEAHAYPARALRSRPPHDPRGSRLAGAALPLLACALCVLAGVLVWSVAEHVPAAQLRDATLLSELTRHDHGTVDRVANRLIGLLSPGLFTLWGVALVAFAFARERPRAAIAVVALMALAPLTAETLKPLLAHPHLSVGGVYIGAASWPSGHSTAALALGLAAVFAAPAKLKPLVAALAALFALAVGLSLLILAWHMPSDVLGGYLVASFWAALALAAVRASERRWPPKRTPQIV